MRTHTVKWESISTAPMDGTIIMTEAGVAAYFRVNLPSQFGYCVMDGWYTTEPIRGMVISEYDTPGNICNPKFWFPIPPLP